MCALMSMLSDASCAAVKNNIDAYYSNTGQSQLTSESVLNALLHEHDDETFKNLWSAMSAY